ncbi:MAG: mannose-1-phosphate guanylyltransferase [Polyangiaceae bacterium]|nr:mannose-1-phosphate guanylyltransferase [Polyangiaceae bacterium]
MRVYAVVMAGGSGTRFWPASRKLRPKQFLPLGGELPLLRATCERLVPLTGWDGVRISTGEHLVAGTLALMPELGRDQLFVEPCPRNTAPCLAWSAWVLARREPEAVIVAVPSDAHVGDAAGYLAAVRTAVASAATGAVTTIGITPTRPETGYGYVELGEPTRVAGAYAVRRFVEKPDAATAAAFLADGRYAWNAGMFIYRAADLCRLVRTHLPELAAALDRLDEAARADAAAGAGAREAALCTELFPTLPSVSIDKGVMEKTEGLAVVPGAFGWSDVGSWLAASELLPRDATGSSVPAGTLAAQARDNCVFDLRPAGSPPRTVALVGVEGLIVVDTGDALLVVDKAHAQDVREVVAALERSGPAELL